MDIILIILGILLLLGGFAGCVAPVLPGPPLAYAAILLLHFTEKVSFTTSQLLIWLLVVVVVQIIDYFIPLLGVKKYGGTKWGNWGCVIGSILGVLFFSPAGIIIGPFLGAVAGELLGGKHTSHALRAGMGAFIGFLMGTLLKVIVCGWFLLVFFNSLF